MILVAFVLVLVATVMLIIGTFFDAGVAYIWISIAACVATFGVLAASYLARRRDGEQSTARPEPLSGDGSRTAPRPTEEGLGTDDEAEEPAAASQDAPAPARRAVAPRRVVPRAASAAPAASEAPVTPSTEDASDEPVAPAAVSAGDQQESAEPEQQPTRVARRRPAASGTTRKVVRRVRPSGTAAAAGTRQVVRRAGTAGAGQTRTVRRVVRRADSATSTAGTPGTASPDTPAQAARTPASNRGGTRGKRAREVLSQVKGVGPAKQDALLKKFGSLEEMAEASIEDLTSVKGVGKSVAQQLKQTLKER